MKKRLLFTLLIVACILLLLNRSAAYIHRPKPDATQIVIYTTTWCSYCNSLRIHLENNSIPFAEYDVEKSIAGIAGFWALRARGVPVSVVGPNIVYGYDIDTINNHLIDLGYDLKLEN